MFLFIAILHIIVCFLLVIFVLLQNPKGGALGVFGGGGSSVFTSTGASDFLVNITKWCAIVFACTSILMAYMNSKKGSSVILDRPQTINENNIESTQGITPPTDSSGSTPSKKNPSPKQTSPEEKSEPSSE